MPGHYKQRVPFTSAPEVASQTLVVTLPWSQSENQHQNVPKRGAHLSLSCPGGMLYMTAETLWKGATWRSEPEVGDVPD